MTKKNFAFDLGNSPTLTLKSLYAEVVVRKGESGKATVEVEGEGELDKLVKVSQPNSNEVLVEGLGSIGGNNITVIQSSHRSSVVIRGSVSGLVVVNGKVISGNENGNVSVIDAIDKMPKITVFVPEGTELDAESVEDLNSQGLNGKLYLSLDGQGKAKIRDVNSAKINCSGQTEADLGNVKGDFKASCSGQSRITARGSFDDVNADTSGQSRIRILGNCRDCEGSASGQSTISLTGHASGKVRKHESGQSSVDIE